MASGGFDKNILVWKVYGDCDNWCILKGHENAVLEVVVVVLVAKMRDGLVGVVVLASVVVPQPFLRTGDCGVRIFVWLNLGLNI